MKAKLHPPAGLDSALVRFGDEELVVLSFPLPALEPPPELTEAEWAVARLVVDGLDNAAIAAARGTAVRTVANQVTSVLRKLGVGSRTALVRRLVDGGR